MEQIERDSSFELLRIISMMFIVMHHLVVHSNLLSNEGVLTFLYYYTGVGGGKFGVNLFVLISGYFLYKSDFKLKRIIRLAVEVIFYSVIISFLFFLFSPDKIGIKTLIKGIIPIHYWFVNMYIVMVLLSPYINKLIDSITQKQFLKLLYFLFILWIVLELVPLIGAFQYSTLGMFLFLYMCAAFLRKYPEFLSKNTIFYIFSFICVLIFYYASLIIFEYTKHEIPNEYFEQNGIFIFLLSLLLFIIFTKISIGNIKLINIISSATFGVYLIHENNFVRDFLWKNLLNNVMTFNSIHLIIYASCFGILVYIVCTLLDLCRYYLFNGAKIIYRNLLYKRKNKII